MRSCLPTTVMSHPLLLLLLLLCSLLLSPISVYGIGANITLYTDSYCKTASGPPSRLPMPFSSICHDLKTAPPSSLIFDCVLTNRGKYTNFTFLYYDGVSDCCGIISSGIQSNDYTGTCATTLMTYSGTQSKIWSRITCDVTSHIEHQINMKQLDKIQSGRQTANTMINMINEMNTNMEYTKNPRRTSDMI